MIVTQFPVIVSMVSYQKGPTRHAYAWQIGPFWQDTLDMSWYWYAIFDTPYHPLWSFQLKLHHQHDPVNNLFVSEFKMTLQGSIWVWAQPMREGITS